ncbi:MAG: hypothetical protein HY280_09485 [Nitrospinae bacterium]|nr:hypothetical protein [Nitrospinota bacterium]
MRHLSLNEIYDAVGFAGEGNVPEKLADHLGRCNRCASAVASLYELGFAFESIGREASRGSVCPSAQELADYIDGNSADKAEIKGHLETCDYCFGAAAHYFSESFRMKKELQTNARLFETPPKFLDAAHAIVGRGKSERVGFFNRWFAPVPAFATAFILFVALFNSAPAQRVGILKDAPYFSIYQKQSNALPYFYFGGEGKRTDVSPANMRVTTRRGSLVFDWIPAKGATSSYFFLQEIVGGAPTKIREVKNAVPPVALPSEEFRPGVVYRWVTAGNIGDDKYFDGRMEFSVSQE